MRFAQNVQKCVALHKLLHLIKCCAGFFSGRLVLIIAPGSTKSPHKLLQQLKLLQITSQTVAPPKTAKTVFGRQVRHSNSQTINSQTSNSRKMRDALTMLLCYMLLSSLPWRPWIISYPRCSGHGPLSSSRAHHHQRSSFFQKQYNNKCCLLLIITITNAHHFFKNSTTFSVVKFFQKQYNNKCCLLFVIYHNSFCVIFRIMNSSLPDWMDGDDTSPKERSKHVPIPISQMSDQERQLELQTFGIAFESSLEQIASGTTIEQFCQKYTDPLGRSLSHGRFRAWIYRDEKRRNAFYAAKALAAEAIEDELLRISDGMLADGSASMDDTARSQLRIQTRWKLLQVYNRKRYGDVKTVEQTNTTKVEIQQMTTDELKKYILSQSGIDIENADFSTDG